MKKLLLATFFVLASWLSSQAQTQMLLPYNDLAFQSSWANAAVRPMHRFSIGLPVISSLEAGVINNAFSLRDISKGDSKRTWYPSLVVPESGKHTLAQEYFEFSTDLLHFRMAWQRWFFWFGMRNQTTQSFLYPTDLLKFAMEGNKWMLGKKLDLNEMRLNVTNYTEFSIGASHPVDRDWVIGGRISLLAGNANADLDVKNLSATVLDDPDRRYAHILKTDAEIRTAGLAYGSNNLPKVPDYARPGTYLNFSNPGFALSGAVSYTLPKLRELKLTFAFTDLGMIHWGDKPGRARLEGKESEFVGAPGFSNILNRNSIDWVFLESLKDQINAKLDNNTKGDPYNTWLSPKFYLMGQYRFARQTEAGLSLAGIVHQGQFYPSVTASIQQGYSALFSGQFAVSYNQRSFLNFGTGLVFSPGICQFYLIADNLYGLIRPLDLQATNIRVGFNIVIGPLYPNNQLTQK